jgi:hypothetical protein
MSYDIAIGADEATLTRTLGQLYARPGLRDRLFRGEQVADLSGVQVPVGWDIQAAPSVRLSAPTEPQWKEAVKEDGNTPQPTQNAFILHLPTVHVSRKQTSGESQDATLPIDVICTAAIDGNRLKLDAEAVIVDLSAAPKFDQLIYRRLIIPQIIKLADSALTAQQFPALQLGGMRFGVAVLAIGDGRAVAVASLEGRPTPPAPSPGGFAVGGFFALLSRDALQSGVRDAVRGFVGKSIPTSGSKGFGLGTADYSASVTISSASAEPAPNDLLTLTGSIGLSASASGGISVVDTITKGLETAGQTIAEGAKTAGEAIANAFKSY